MVRFFSLLRFALRAPRAPLLSPLPPKYRIAWSSGSFHGHGEYCLTASTAQAWIDILSAKYKDMLHWSEAIDEAPLFIPSVENVDVFVPEFDDLPNVISDKGNNLVPKCYTCTTLEG